MRHQEGGSIGGALFLIGIGSLFLLSNYGYVNLYFWNLLLVWPLFLLWPGISLVLNYLSPSTRKMNDLAVSVLCMGIVFSVLIQPPSMRAPSSSISRPLGLSTSASISIDHGAGRLEIYPAAGGNLYDLSYTSPPGISYSEKDGTAFADIDSSGFPMPFSETLQARLTTLIPINLSVDTGMSSYSLDLSGLRLNSLDLDSGASTGEIIWKSSNPVSLLNMDIDAGATGLSISGIGHSQVRNFTFNGGAGSYTFDFSGDYSGVGYVSISAGVSSIALIIPPGTGAQVRLLSDVASTSTSCLLSIDSKTYQTQDFDSSSSKFYITVDGSLSSVEIDAC